MIDRTLTGHSLLAEQLKIHHQQLQGLGEQIGAEDQATIRAEAHVIVEDLVALSRDLLSHENKEFMTGMLEKITGEQPISQGDVQQMRQVVQDTLQRIRTGPVHVEPQPEVVVPSPNATRAKETGDELLKLQQRHGPERMTDDLIRMLTAAVDKPRSADARETTGIMGRDSALKTARALIEMPPEDFARVRDLLADAAVGARDPKLEQALLLKAIGAGYTPPRVDSPPTLNAPFFERLALFAAGIHGESGPSLLRSTTLVGQETLQQRYTHSCGPSVIQMLKGQQDPIFAWELHQGGAIGGLDANTQAARQQKEWLEAGGGLAIPRSLQADVADVQTPYSLLAVMIIPDRLGALQGTKLQDLKVLQQYIGGKIDVPSQQQKSQIARAFEDLHRNYREDLGAIRTATLDRIHQVVLQCGLAAVDGSNIGTGMPLTPELLLDKTGLHYDDRGFELIDDDEIDANWDKAAEELDAGRAIPLGIGGGGSAHFLLLSDVRGEGPGREFLVTDPMDATTSWVSEQALRPKVKEMWLPRG